MMMTPRKFGDLLLVDHMSQTVFHDDDHDATPSPSPSSSTGGSSTNSDLDTPPIVLPAVLSQPSTDLDRSRLRHKCGSELESPPASTLSPAAARATVPTKEKVSSVSCHISKSRTQNGCYGDAVPVQPLIQCQDVSTHSLTSPAIMIICSYLRISVAGECYYCVFGQGIGK
jgi:hypothetical protein